MDLSSKITPDNVQDLRQIWGDSESIGDYRYIENLVKAVLFSRFPERKEYATKQLMTNFNPWTKLIAIKDQGILYAYLSITKERDAFLLVGKYLADGRVLEEVPDEVERALWAER